MDSRHRVPLRAVIAKNSRGPHPQILGGSSRPISATRSLGIRRSILPHWYARAPSAELEAREYRLHNNHVRTATERFT